MLPTARSAWLLTSVLLAACGDLPLRRAASALADSVPEPPGSPTPPTASVRAKRETTPTRAEEAFSQIRRSLRRLVVAEETFFAENGTYSDELSLIGFRPDSNTSIRFLWLSREGWAASGTHTALGGRDCVIYVGQAPAPPTTLKYVRSGGEGVPVCDDHATPPKPVASAPPRSSRPSSPETGSALDLLDPRVVMKVDLRNLAHSQETYLAMQGTYARRTQALALQYLWHKDVRIKILEADPESWAAEATHARAPGKSCVIWVGAVPRRPATDALRRQETRAGVPVCDD